MIHHSKGLWLEIWCTGGEGGGSQMDMNLRLWTARQIHGMEFKTKPWSQMAFELPGKYLEWVQDKAVVSTGIGLTLEQVQRYCWTSRALALCTFDWWFSTELTGAINWCISINIEMKEMYSNYRQVQSEVICTWNSIEFKRMLSVVHCLVAGSISIWSAFPLTLQIRWQEVNYIFTLPSWMKSQPEEVWNLLKRQRMMVRVWEIYMVGGRGDIGERFEFC